MMKKMMWYLNLHPPELPYALIESANNNNENNNNINDDSEVNHLISLHCPDQLSENELDYGPEQQ